jgi:hypothetical protein
MLRKTPLTRTDERGRVWRFNDAEGTWDHGKHLIGCGGRNGSKWSIWAGPDRGHREFKTLTEAIQSCQ